MYGFEISGTTANTVNGLLIWTIISIVVAIIGGIALYILFLKSDKKLDNTLSKLRDFLNFKTLVIEDVLKVSYLILAIFITLYSFGLIGVNIGSFFAMIIVGNFILRITYELTLLIIKICKNTTEINNKLKK